MDTDTDMGMGMQGTAAAAHAAPGARSGPRRGGTAGGLSRLMDVVAPMAEGLDDMNPVARFAARCKRMYDGRPDVYDLDVLTDCGITDRGAARVILCRRIPGVGVGDIIDRLERWKSGDPAILSPAEGSPDPAAGTAVIIDSLADFMVMGAAGFSEGSIAAAAAILARSMAGSLIRVPLGQDGKGLDTFLRFRAAISPDGDPITPGKDDEYRSLAPYGRRRVGAMFGWMSRDGFEYDPEAPAILSAMCRPAILGYDPSAVTPPSGRHDDVHDMLASMRHIPGLYKGILPFPDPSRGILMGVTSLLAAMDGRDRDRDMALMGAAQTLTDAGLEAVRRYGDYEAILTGDALADAVMDGFGLPAGFVVETAMAGSPGPERQA